MFEKLKKIFKNRDEKEKHEDTDKENAPISYDNVAIPEVHIRNRKNK